MLAPSLPGQFVVFGLQSTQIPGGTSGSGGAGPVRNVTTNFAVQTTENGYTYYDATTSSNTGTIPAGLPIGFTLKFVPDKASGSLVMQFSGSETASYAGGSTSAAGSLSWSAAVQGSIMVQKVAATRWMTIAAAGSGATPA